MVLCKSGDLFAKAYISEDQISWIDGHVKAFEYFLGVPKEIIYDNATTLVKKIERYGARELTKKFTELKSHYLFEPIFANPGKGNEKGIVENKVGYVRRNFFVPKPEYKSIDEMNKQLLKWCLARREKKHHKENKVIKDFLIKEADEFLSLPQYAYETCDTKLTKANSYSLVVYKTNEYSVPSQYAYRDIILKASVEKIRIFYKDKEIATHKRCFERHTQIFDYQHYLPVLSQKSRALDNFAPIQNMVLPKEFERLRKALEKRYDGSKGKREYIKILELLKNNSKAEVSKAIKKSFEIGVIHIDSIKQILYQKEDFKVKEVIKINLDKNLMIEVSAPSLKKYDQLCGN